MAIAPAARQMNLSSHTLADLQALAQAEPQKATEYLTHVERALRTSGKTAEADTVAALLCKTGDLFERVTASADQLTAIFPKAAADWANVQLERAATIGYDTSVTGPPPQFVQGQLSVAPGKLLFTTDGGRELELAPSPLSRKPLQMGNDMMEGFIGDGPMTLSGTLGEDNKTFNVEGYALNSDGKFDDFTYGRVTVAADQVTIDGPRGPVEITNPELQKVLRAMPRFAVIVPGAPEEQDGKLVMGKGTDTLIGLARFKEAPPAAATGPTVSMKANMADNHFIEKPLVFPAEQLGRANHGSRLWARGMVELDPAGQAVCFKASYVSQQLDRRTLPMGTASQDADPVQAAVMQDIV